MSIYKFDIVKFYGINDFIETGIVKDSFDIDSVHQQLEIQTLDKKSISYFIDSDLVIEKISHDENFDFNVKSTYQIGDRFELNFSKRFIEDYYKFYENGFGEPIEKTTEDLKDHWNVEVGNVYELKIYEINGINSYLCELNHHAGFSTFMIHDELLKNHARQLCN